MEHQRVPPGASSFKTCQRNRLSKRQCVWRGLGDAWQPIQRYWREPTLEHRNAIRTVLNAEGMKYEYSLGIPNPFLIRPESDTLDAALLARPGNVDIQFDLFLDYASNVKMYPQFQEYFRKQSRRSLPWGKFDAYFIPAGAEGF